MLVDKTTAVTNIVIRKCLWTALRITVNMCSNKKHNIPKVILQYTKHGEESECGIEMRRK